MTKEEFIADIIKEACECVKLNKSLRFGQAVFHIVDDKYNSARNVQFSRQVDCYYDNSKIYEFLSSAYEVIF